MSPSSSHQSEQRKICGFTKRSFVDFRLLKIMTGYKKVKKLCLVDNLMYICSMPVLLGANFHIANIHSQGRVDGQYSIRFATLRYIFQNVCKRACGRKNACENVEMPDARGRTSQEIEGPSD